MTDFSYLSQAWMSLFVLHTFEISCFILLVWLADSVFRFSTRYRYMLWLVALVKIFLPPLLSAPANLQQQVAENVFILPVLSPASATSSEPYFTAVQIAFLIWAFISLCLMVFILLKNLRLRVQLRRAKPIEPPEHLRRFGRISFFETSKFISPVLLGLFRPKLYLPLLWRNWSPGQLRSVVAHEFAHHQSGDLWILLLQYLAVTLFWCNPLVWLVHFRLSQLREIRCDEIALQETNLSSSEYSRLLLRLVWEQHNQLPQVLFGRSFSGRKKVIYQRIKHILNHKEAAMKKSIVHVIVPVFLALLLVPFSWRCSGDSSAPGSGSPANSLVDAGEEAFQKYDTPPVPVGGLQAIQSVLKYPEIARKAGIEGKVVVQALITHKGEVEETTILEPAGGKSGLNEAAMLAVKSVKWRPAMLDDKPVSVKVALPVVYKL